MREYKHKISFASTVRCPIDSNISLASIADLTSLLPENRSEALLPIAGNVCVVGMFNENGHGVSKDVGLAIAQKFLNTRIDLEHKQDHIFGHITSANFTRFDPEYKTGAGSEILNPSDIKDEPFNIGVGGYLYKDIFPSVIAKIIESNDPKSDYYLQISMSWELSFDKAVIALGSKLVDECEIIEDEKEIEKLEKFLKENGGRGTTPEGKIVSKLVVFANKEDGSIDLDSVVPLGLGITLNPAAKVAGLLVGGNESNNKETSEASKYSCPDREHETEIIETGVEADGDLTMCPKCKKSSLSSKWKKSKSSEANIENNPNNTDLEKNTKKVDKNENKSSHLENVTVKPNITKNMKTLKSLAEVLELNDESKQEVSLANLKNLIEAGISEDVTKAVKEYQARVDAEKAEAEKQKQEVIARQAKITELEAKVSELQASLEALTQQSLAAEASRKFSERMAAFDETYELTDEDRKIIANRIKNMSDEDYSYFSEKEFPVLAREKNKEVVAAKKKETSKASVETPEEILAKTKETATAATPNTVNPEKDKNAKYRDAFKLENFEIITKR